MARYVNEDVVERDDVRVDRHVNDGWTDTLARVLAGLALVIGLLGFIVAWQAYDRTGDKLDQRIKDGVNASVNTVRDGVNNAADAIDAGPDGVDGDDTDVVPGN